MRSKLLPLIGGLLCASCITDADLCVGGGYELVIVGLHSDAMFQVSFDSHEFEFECAVGQDTCGASGGGWFLSAQIPEDPEHAAFLQISDERHVGSKVPRSVELFMATSEGTYQRTSEPEVQTFSHGDCEAASDRWELE